MQKKNSFFLNKYLINSNINQFFVILEPFYKNIKFFHSKIKKKKFFFIEIFLTLVTPQSIA
jgi:hypothetical protein